MGDEKVCVKYHFAVDAILPPCLTLDAAYHRMRASQHEPASSKRKKNSFKINDWFLGIGLVVEWWVRGMNGGIFELSLSLKRSPLWAQLIFFFVEHIQRKVPPLSGLERVHKPRNLQGFEKKYWEEPHMNKPNMDISICDTKVTPPPSAPFSSFQFLLFYLRLFLYRGTQESLRSAKNSLRESSASAKESKLRAAATRDGEPQAVRTRKALNKDRRCLSCKTSLGIWNIYFRNKMRWINLRAIRQPSLYNPLSNGERERDRERGGVDDINKRLLFHNTNLGRQRPAKGDGGR